MESSSETTAPAPAANIISEQHQSPAEATAKKTSQLTLEDAHDELDVLLDSGRVTIQEVAAIQHTLKEHSLLREKVSKLKSLLGRSAKAQRESKVELEACQRKLAQKEEQVSLLTKKVEKLASRPTHMDLLADFETNFDKALLNAQSQQQQSGQDTFSQSAATTPAATTTNTEPVDTMLLQELTECKSRMDSLETLNAHSKQRNVALEQECASLKREKEHYQHSLKTLQLELRMSKMETEHATRSLEDKMASLQEMQLEIDLVTKASVNASVRAAQGEEIVNSLKSDRQLIQDLQSQVQALQEWALASAEAKSLAMEHVKILERQLQHYKHETASSSSSLHNDGADRHTHVRLLWQKSSSLVIGAGDVGFKVLELGDGASSLILKEERVVLQWKFDVTPADLSVVFSLLQGNCDSPSKHSGAVALIQDRTVTGGAAGETPGAFDTENACTLLWSNASSWVRPRTIKYTVEVVAVKD